MADDSSENRSDEGALELKPAARKCSTDRAKPKKEKGHKKKAKKATKIKPDGMPKRPLSAYNLFFREQRKLIVSERKGDDATQLHSELVAKASREELDSTPESPLKPKLFETMARTIAQRWKGLSPEQHAYYTQLAEVETKRYKEEVELYHQSKIRKSVQAVQDSDQRRAAEAATQFSAVTRNPEFGNLQVVGVNARTSESNMGHHGVHEGLASANTGRQATFASAEEELPASVIDNNVSSANNLHSLNIGLTSVNIQQQMQLQQQRHQQSQWNPSIGYPMHTNTRQSNLSIPFPSIYPPANQALLPGSQYQHFDAYLNPAFANSVNVNMLHEQNLSSLNNANLRQAMFDREAYSLHLQALQHHHLQQQRRQQLNDQLQLEILAQALSEENKRKERDEESKKR